MTRPKLTLKNMILHARKICVHRKWVRYYCRLAGIPLRGWLHDLSKYSPAEFFESSRYYVGISSPIKVFLMLGYIIEVVIVIIIYIGMIILKKAVIVI